VFSQLHGYKMIGTNGTTVCQFELNDGKTDEFGVMALKNGDIIRQDVWLSNNLTKNTNSTKEELSDQK